MELGIPGHVLDSCFRGNDRTGGGFHFSLPALQWCALLCVRGRAEGRSPTALFHHSNPLFTLIDCPVIIAARSEARKAMVSATSFESGNLPRG